MTNLIQKLDNIDSLKRELDKLKPLSDVIEKKINTWFDNAIIRNSTIKDMNSEELKIPEISYKEALDYTRELSVKNIGDLKCEDILKIHSILFKDICQEYAGKYRDSGDAYVILRNGERAEVCHFSLIPDEMVKFFNWFFSIKKEHPLVTAAEAHNKIVSIHPFINSNGKTAKLIMNFVLMQNGYAPIIIKMPKTWEEYDSAIKSWRNDKKDDFYNIIADCEIDSLETYIREIKSYSF